ncbi:MAG: hypothetical protein M0P71_05485 [Melioribacteraceae bacterium]|nr:hypothetical protein [Melioribacteraceae bacterium]
MKKFFTISFALIYLFLVVGVNVAIHFCGDSVDSVQFALTENPGEPDSCCGMECGIECCKTEIKTTKIEDLHKSETEFKINSFEIAMPFQTNIETASVVSHTIIPKNITDNSPPGRDIRISYCSFLI